MCVNISSKVALDSAAAGIEPATSSRKSNALTTTPPSHILTYLLIILYFATDCGDENDRSVDIWYDSNNDCFNYTNYSSYWSDYNFSSNRQVSVVGLFIQISK